MVNACRLCRQVTSLAEITHHNGVTILDCAFYGLQSEDDTPILNKYSQSKLNWPAQSYPPRIAWKVWKNYLLNLCHPINILKKSLGQWNPHIHTHKTWLYVSHGTSILGMNSSQARNYIPVSQQTRHRHTYQFSMLSQHQLLP
jgi:hypothetical protein